MRLLLLWGYFLCGELPLDFGFQPFVIVGPFQGEFANVLKNQLRYGFDLFRLLIHIDLYLYLFDEAVSELCFDWNLLLGLLHCLNEPAYLAIVLIVLLCWGLLGILWLFPPLSYFLSACFLPLFPTRILLLLLLLFIPLFLRVDELWLDYDNIVDWLVLLGQLFEVLSLLRVLI